eukprot:6188668-Pleurochrysis_carterae.AAC.1
MRANKNARIHERQKGKSLGTLSLAWKRQNRSEALDFQQNRLEMIALKVLRNNCNLWTTSCLQEYGRGPGGKRNTHACTAVRAFRSRSPLDVPLEREVDQADGVHERHRSAAPQISRNAAQSPLSVLSPLH